MRRLKLTVDFSEWPKRSIIDVTRSTGLKLQKKKKTAVMRPATDN